MALATIMSQRPGTSGTVGASANGGMTAPGTPGLSSMSIDGRRPSLGSVPSFRSKHTAITSTLELPRPVETNFRSGAFRFARSALPKYHSNITQKRKKNVRSQYPAGTIDKHVEYILVASFDIDLGSIMEHQYPAPIGGDANMLAELMLPDQAHLRAQDWTMFFLHKDAPDDDVTRATRTEKRKQITAEKLRRAVDGGDVSDDDDADDNLWEDEDLKSVEGPPLVYVLNLVMTKQDKEARRGAVCKALAICTPHPFLHIYKPFLLLALEEYFKNPVPASLAAFYDSVNAMDLSPIPKLSVLERMLLQSSDARDLFSEKYEALTDHSIVPRTPGSGMTTPLDPRARPQLPRDTHEYETKVPYNGVGVPVRIPTALFPENVGDFSLIRLIQTFSNPHTTSPQPFQTLHPHLTTSGPLTHPVIVLLNAILTQKRIVFIGHNLPSSTVAEAVLGSCALASGGMLRGFVRHAFPYTDLTKVDELLKIPGFIAGVTNPTFSQHAEWWDLHCDLTTGRMRISPKIEPAPMTDGAAYFLPGGTGASAMGTIAPNSSAFTSTGNVNAVYNLGDATGDNAFLNNVLTAISERQGEGAIRAKFRLWIFKFTRIAAAFEELIYGASALVVSTPQLGSANSTSPELRRASHTTSTSTSSQANSTTSSSDVTKGYGYVFVSQSEKLRELGANATRVEGWMKTRSYYNYIQDLAVYYSYRAIKTLDLQHCHDKLVKLRLGSESAAQIYLAICAAVQSDEQINALLVTVVNASPSAVVGPVLSFEKPGGGGPAGAPGTSSSSSTFTNNYVVSSTSPGGSTTVLPIGGGTGGLFHIALGLFHPKLEVREKVADLLSRIRDHDAGRHFWNRLGGFEKTAWERLESAKRDRDG